MSRTIVDIPKEQLSALAKICKQSKISRAEAVRQAIRLFVSQHSKATKNRGDDAFGLWSDRGVDGLAYEDVLRHEWGS